MRKSYFQSSKILTAVLGLCALLSGCDGSASGKGSCRSNASCAAGYYCAGPNDRPPCGIPPREECADNASCPDGACHAINDSCSADGVGSQCGAECTVTSCGPGFRCNLQKACESIPCDEGFTCPSHQRCDSTVAHATGPVYARTSGCVPIACAADADCPAGKACVNSACADGPGTCRQDLPVP